VLSYLHDALFQTIQPLNRVLALAPEGLLFRVLRRNLQALQDKVIVDCPPTGPEVMPKSGPEMKLEGGYSVEPNKGTQSFIDLGK